MSYLNYYSNKSSRSSNVKFFISAMIFGCAQVTAMEMDIDQDPLTSPISRVSSTLTQTEKDNFEFYVERIKNNDFDIWKGFCASIENNNPFIKMSIKNCLDQLFLINPELMKSKIIGFVQSNLMDEKNISHHLLYFLAYHQNSWAIDWLGNFDTLNLQEKFAAMDILSRLSNQEDNQFNWAREKLVLLTQYQDEDQLTQKRAYTLLQNSILENTFWVQTWILMLSITENALAREVVVQIVTPLLVQKNIWAIGFLRSLYNSPIYTQPGRATVRAIVEKIQPLVTSLEAIEDIFFSEDYLDSQSDIETSSEDESINDDDIISDTDDEEQD